MDVLYHTFESDHLIRYKACRSSFSKVNRLFHAMALTGPMPDKMTALKGVGWLPF